MTSSRFTVPIYLIDDFTEKLEHNGIRYTLDASGTELGHSQFTDLIIVDSHQEDAAEAVFRSLEDLPRRVS